jgi:hypothetical protein
MNSAPLPAGNGDPETGDREPEALTANADTIPEPELVTKAKLMARVELMFALMFAFIPHPFRSKKIKSRKSIDNTNKLALW